MKFFIVDAFTRQPFGGNTAGVVLLERGDAFPADAWMQSVAAELRYSETAFVRPDIPEMAGTGEAVRSFTVRYFTPAGEIDLCGHATIASFGVLVREGHAESGVPCRCRTRAGDLEVVPAEEVMMQMGRPRSLRALITSADLAPLLQAMGGLPSEALAPLPVEIVSTGLPDIILPIRDVDTLQALRPDMAALTALSDRFDVVGVHAFAFPEAGASADAAADCTAHVRNFAPRYGIPEESATGTANGALAFYLYRQGLIRDAARCLFLQGAAMGRPSSVMAMLHLVPDGSAQGMRPDVRVGGPFAIVARGEI